MRVSLEVGTPSFCHSFPLLSYFLIAPISFFSRELEAPLCACGLFTRNTDSPSEVWLAGTRRGEKYEWICPTPTPPPPYSQILPSSFFLSKCSSATSSHTFPLVCMHVCQRECICAKPEGRPTLARGSFLWPGQCVSRRAAGVSGASSSFQLHSLTLGPLHRVFATSHCLVIFEILQDKKPVLSFKHLFKMTGCVCGTCRGDGAEEMGEKTTCIQNWEELWEWVSWLGWRWEVLD